MSEQEAQRLTVELQKKIKEAIEALHKENGDSAAFWVAVESALLFELDMTCRFLERSGKTGVLQRTIDFLTLSMQVKT